MDKNSRAFGKQISSSMEKQREENSARVIQKAWRVSKCNKDSFEKLSQTIEDIENDVPNSSHSSFRNDASWGEKNWKLICFVNSCL